MRGKVSLITGAGQGIGRAIAISFAKHGSIVVVNDFNLAHASSVVTEIEADNGEAFPIQGDVSDKNAVNTMITDIIEKFGKIDILVNNAGIQTVNSFLNLSVEEWQKVMDVNLKGTFLCSQRVANEMVKRGKGGRIINISSIHHSIPRYNKSHYDASKAGVWMLTKDMALELSKYGINVNCIAPGAIATPMNQDLLDSKEKLERIESLIPFGEIGCPEEVAKAALFFASDDSSYITGAILKVDGGLSLRSDE